MVGFISAVPAHVRMYQKDKSKIFSFFQPPHTQFLGNFCAKRKLYRRILTLFVLRTISKGD